MSDHDTEFLEGDQPGQSRKGDLIRRMANFIVPHRRPVAVAALLIPLCIGLELLLPVITRTAIDSYLVPFHLRVDAGRLESSLHKILGKALEQRQVPVDSEIWYVAESDWRDLDPALIAQIRKAGVVDSRRWYAAPADESILSLIDRHPGQFQRAGPSVLISEDDLKRLPSEDLKRLRRSDARGLIGMAALFSAMAAMLLAISYFQTVFLERAGQRMMKDLRLFLFHHVLTRSQSFFSANPVGKLVTRINNDVQSMAELFRNMVVGLLKDLLLFGGIAMVMFALNARLAAVCMLVVPPMGILAWFFARISKRLFRQLKGYTGRLNTGLQEAIAGLATIKLLGAQARIDDKLTGINNRYFQAGLAQTKLFAVFTPLMELVGSLAVALIIWYGGGVVIQDRLSLGTLVAFISYIQMLLAPVRDLSEKYNQLQGALASTERIFAVIDDPRTLETSEVGSKQAPLDGNADIVFEGVEFGYRPDRKVLDGFDLTIPTGQTVTLVGPSGGGKSTLVNLLLRLYDPLGGKILLGDRPLTTIAPYELVRRVALVSQEMVLLSASIEDNIVLGRSQVTPSMLERAIEISGVDTWVNALPQGIDTRVGEGGRTLSQGQCQMLALARALAGDPRILILDEAFSQIDPESEKLIVSRLPSIMAGRTCITVAHRLATARHSRRILVVRDGRIVEDGDHRALMDADGIYAGMVALELLHHRIESVPKETTGEISTEPHPGKVRFT